MLKPPLGGIRACVPGSHRRGHSRARTAKSLQSSPGLARPGEKGGGLGGAHCGAVVVGPVPWMLVVSSTDRVVLGVAGPGRPRRRLTSFALVVKS